MTELPKLPPLPAIPEGDRSKDVTKFRSLGQGGGMKLYECWYGAIEAYARDYGAECRRQALEEAAAKCDDMWNRAGMDCAANIRALKDEA